MRAKSNRTQVRDRDPDQVDEGQAESDCNRGEAGRCAPIGRAQDDHQEHEGEDELRNDRRLHRVAVRGMLSETVRREAPGEIEARLAARDQVEDTRTCEPANDLANDVRDNF